MSIQKKRNKLNNIYFCILIILLIFSFIVSFKTGESIYYLLNTNSDNLISNSSSQIADWNFTVRIEY